MDGDSQRNSERSIDTATDVTKCACCGSVMVFDPADSRLRCIHCDSRKAIPVHPVREIPYDGSESVFGFSSTDDRSISYRCESCGAVSIMGKFETAEKCPFCGVPNIARLDDMPIIHPNAILPFKVSMEQAKQAFGNWVSKRLMAPREFKKTFSTDNVRGAYLPAWTFDSDTVARYHGRLGKTVTRVVGSGKNRRTVTEIQWFSVSGTMDRRYDDLMIEASKSIVQKELNAVMPFDTQSAVGFDESFVSGFSSERYDKELNVAWGEAKSRIRKEYQNAIVRRYNADRVDYLNIDITYNRLTYKHILLPMWIDVYKYKKKQYRILVNGRTAKVGGKTPVSKVKIGGLIFAGLVIVALIALYILKN